MKRRGEMGWLDKIWSKVTKFDHNHGMICDSGCVEKRLWDGMGNGGSRGGSRFDTYNLLCGIVVV